MEITRKRHYGELRALVQANAALKNPVPWRDFAEMHNLKRGTVYSTIKKLRLSGKMPAFKTEMLPAVPVGYRVVPKDVRRPSDIYKKPPPKPETEQIPAPEPPKISLIDLEHQLDALDPIGRRKMLAYMASNSTDNNRLGAINKLEELDRMAGGKTGPPDPETDEDYAKRLGMMLYAAGPARTQLAINWAAQHKEEETATAPKDPVGPDGHEDGSPEGHGPGPVETPSLP